MLPYQEKLEKLLESLFDDDADSDEINVWIGPIGPSIFNACCIYSYTSYTC